MSELKTLPMPLRVPAGALTRGLILCFALTIAACHKSQQTKPVDTPLDLPAGSSAVTGAANQFAVNVFQQTLRTEPAGTNLLISPMSIFFCLDMTYNGAANATADSMAATLQLTGVPTNELNSVNNALLTQLPKEDNQVQLDIANSIFYKNSGPQPATAFLNTISSSYPGAAQALDFTNPSSVNTINSWVAKNTENKIPTIIKSIDAGEVMFLINAIYFHGGWMHQFQTSATKDDQFNLSNGSNVSVPFMNLETRLRYHADSSLTMLELPYGTGEAFDLYLVMPQSNTPITTFAASLDATTIDNDLASLDTADIQISIPKWEYSYDIDNMAPELSALGMGIAFSNAADFTNMYTSGGISISRVIHKTYIQVDEEGTTAAAATATGMSGVTIARPQTLKFDHPFVYLIRERQTGMILFIGAVNDPSQN